MDIIHKFTLNEAQQRVFRIIADHTLGRSKVGPQLRLGVFGEAGTGKSRLIAAVRAWFAVLNRQNELVVTAPTGTAALNVAGITLPSAANLPIGNQRKKKIGSKTKHWTHRQYLIMDEVSMMDCKMPVNLNTNLKEAKHRHDDYFGGINIIFMGDFLQLATVSHLDVYVENRQNGSMVITMEIHQPRRLAHRANETIIYLLLPLFDGFAFTNRRWKTSRC